MKKYAFIILSLVVIANCPEFVQVTVSEENATEKGSDFSIDRIAIEALDRAQALSIHDNREYCGLIGYDPSGELIATEPLRGEFSRCQLPQDPPGWNVVAIYHTHGAYSPAMDTEAPSIGDLQLAFREQIDNCIATPGGRVWHVSISEFKAIMLCGINCVTADRNFKP